LEWNFSRQWLALPCGHGGTKLYRGLLSVGCKHNVSGASKVDHPVFGEDCKRQPMILVPVAKDGQAFGERNTADITMDRSVAERSAWSAALWNIKVVAGELL